MSLLELLVIHTKLAHTRAEARRMIYSGGVKLNGEIIKDVDIVLDDGEYIVEVGRRGMKKVTIKDGDVLINNT